MAFNLSKVYRDRVLIGEKVKSHRIPMIFLLGEQKFNLQRSRWRSTAKNLAHVADRNLSLLLCQLTKTRSMRASDVE